MAKVKDKKRKKKSSKGKSSKRKRMKMGTRADVKESDFPDPLKFKKGYVDTIRVISDEFEIYDMHRKRLSASSYVYANCKGKKGCPLCKAGDDPKERYALEVLHISRSKIGKKKKQEINEIIPWAFAGRMQNELTDLFDEEGELTGYNIKLKCREADQEQFQNPTINKTKGKLDKEQRELIKEKRGKIIDSFIQPSKDEYLNKMAAKLRGEDEDEDEEDMDDDDFDESEDDDDFEDEDFDDAIADMEDEDDDDEDDEDDDD